MLPLEFLWKAVIQFVWHQQSWEAGEEEEEQPPLKRLPLIFVEGGFSDGHSPRTRVELSCLKLMVEIVSKPDWLSKVEEPTILLKWATEACVDLSVVAFAVAELKHRQ